MVPKIIKGHSFKGAAAYLLTGKDGQDRDRVAFTETRNLLTENPDIAWRAMIATARDQDRLKQQAGVTNTGRKSTTHVLHMVLSFHQDEAAGLTREKMQQAADGAMAAIGAKDHQALIVSHNDTDHPHLHLLINRVHPINGKMLSSSNDRLKASRWAQKWEEANGIYCDQRIINNAARDSEYIRDKDTPKHLIEAAGRPVNDNVRDPKIIQLKDNERAKNGKIIREQAALKQRQSVKWSGLEREYKTRQRNINQGLFKEIIEARKPIRAAYRQRRAELHHQTQAEVNQFAKNEDSWVGRWANRFKSIDLLAVIRDEKKVKAVSGVFTSLVSPAARLQKKLQDIARQEAALKNKQKKDEKAVARQIMQSSRAKAKLAELRTWYQVERASLSLECSVEDARYRARWQERSKARRKSWEPVRRQEIERKAARRKPRKPRKARVPREKLTKAGDLLPKDGAAERAVQIDAQNKRSQRRAERKRNRQDHDKGKDGDRGR